MSVAKPNVIEQAFKSTAFKEAGYQYFLLILIIVSNLWDTVGWSEIIALGLSLAIFLFGGWLKKIAELKIDEILRVAERKDAEILALKEIKIKLQGEVDKYVEQLTRAQIQKEN